jgi:hypothetical protein
MINFLLDLISNQDILAVVATVCCAINLTRTDVRLNGYHVFIGLVGAALLVDAALTFLVFADSQSRYGTFSTTHAFLQRAAAYLAACAIAFYFARLRTPKPHAPAVEHVVIPTSPYSNSQLPM